MGGTVRAAGGVPWRDGPSGVEVALVHRPRYRDWTLPKGKLERDEHELAAAIREVQEETGLTCTPQVRLPTITYLTAEPGVEKVVDFWSMRVRHDAGREPDDEIAEVRWMALPAAAALLDYAHDRGVLATFAALPRVTAEVSLVRHGAAGSRMAWHEADRLRPLDSAGHEQAQALARLLVLTAPERIVSAAPVRCRETLSPLADALGMTVKVDPAFDEESPDGIGTATAALRLCAAESSSTVICSQGKVIAPLLRSLRPGNTTTAEDYHTPKGTGWLLALAGTDVVSADRLTP